MSSASFRLVVITFGSDISPEALEIAAGNLKKANVAALAEVKRMDVKDFAVPEEKSIVVCNPPYGERLLDAREAELRRGGKPEVLMTIGC